MGKIILLDDLTINKIAAGEVIERPASAIKEVMENSIDAGATSITVEIRNGGISYIRVTDNGKGIKPDDMEIAFERHATSKLRNADELNEITSMGFRGEALASIAAIAKVTLVSKTRENDIGYQVVAEGGKIIEKQEAGCQNGTSITIENLFFNTPVRYKFLKKDFTESGYIEDVVTRIALVHPEIAVKFINTGKTVIQTSGNGDIKAVIYNIFGKEVTMNLINVDYKYEDIEVKGVVGKPVISRSNRANQLFFVNNRFVKDKTLSSSAEQAFKGLLAPGKHGFLVLNLTMDPRKVDVNVHPAKLEVRFQDESKIFKAVYHSIKEALLSDNTQEKTALEEINDLQQKITDTKINENKTVIPTNNYTNIETNEKKAEESVNDYTKIYKNEPEPSEKEVKNEETFEQVMAKLKRMQNIVDKVKDLPGTNTITNTNYQEEHTNSIFNKNISSESNENIEKYEKSKLTVNENTETYNPISMVNIESENKLQEALNTISNIENTMNSAKQDIKVDTTTNILEEKQETEPKIEPFEKNEDTTPIIETQIEQPKEKYTIEPKTELNYEGIITKENINEEGSTNEKENTQNNIEEKIKENFNNKLKNQPVIENNQYSGETLSNQEEKIESSAQEEKSYNDYDFLKMYEKNFGLAVKPQEEKEKIDVSSEFKPTTGEENLSVFGNNEEFSVKPVYKFIGIAFENYFVIEMQDSLYIIDQKKANERIVYENIKNNYYSNNRNSQLMLLPDIVTLTYRQMGIYKDNREMFEKAGFSIEEFGENTLKISGVPEIILDLETKDIFLDTLEEINTVARTAKQEIEEKFIRCLAKNSANQEKKIQNAQEAVALLDKLLVLPEPFDVTEGSTSAIKMTKADIEKKFSRRK